MDKFGVSNSDKVVSEEENTSLYPMFFGVSCALVALDFMSKPVSHNEKWCEVRNRMLQGSAHLLGLLVWRIQKEEAKIEKSDLLLKLENAQREMDELKKRRSEDARANEKVVGIFAAQEQGWFSERKKLRQQLGALVNELRLLEAKKDKVISELNERLRENETLFQSKDNDLKQELQKRQELEEKLKEAEEIAREVKERAEHEAQRHSAEITKHKTAFIELVSNQRQLEAEMSRSLRQCEAAKQDLDLVLEQKEQSVIMTQKLSVELVKTRKELQQKDQILSAMLRKSKLDTEEKEVLFKEAKCSKAKRKQTEIESKRWKVAPASKHERVSLRSILSKYSNFKVDASSVGKGVHANEPMPSYPEMSRNPQIGYLLEHQHQEPSQVFLSTSDQYLIKEDGGRTSTEQLEGWVQSQSERNRSSCEQKHTLEIDAFAEQLRLKDEKVEAFRWRLLSMELESKRLKSHIEGLNRDVAQLREFNTELEALLLNREEELHALREDIDLQWRPPDCQRTKLKSSLHDPAIAPDIIWSKVKIIKKTVGQKELGIKAIEADTSPEVNIIKEKFPANNQAKDIVLTLGSPEKKKSEERKATRSGQVEYSKPGDDVQNAQSTTSVGQIVGKNNSSAWKMDLHALGVSYKIKRLQQQLVMFERLSGKQENSEISGSNDYKFLGQKTSYTLLSLLTKQIGRYQSLQGKIDDICRRMHNHDLGLKCRSSKVAKTDVETKLLGQFLEETFQLQRYIVATGQKLMEVQAQITTGLLNALEVLDTPASFDVKRFADGIRNLLSEVQRGLEVRISQIIGELEGTLASDGIVHMRR